MRIALALLGGICARGATESASKDLIEKTTPAAWNAAALSEVVGYVRSQRTTGFLIIDEDRVVVEENWPLPADAALFKANVVSGVTVGGALIEDVASAQKSLIAILIGVAVDKGLIDVTKPVALYAGSGWSNVSPPQEEKISVRNLMEMNSGLKEDLTYETEPGTKFFYNTPVYAKTKLVLEGASKESLAHLTRLWLTEPLGMSDTSWRERSGAAAAVNPTGLVTSPRDLAKLGQLVLDGGKAADGKRVISQAQLTALFVHSGTNPSYGRLWWLNTDAGSPNSGAKRPLIPAAPSDLVAAFGSADRKLFVVPSRKLIVVRTGQTALDKNFDQELWSRLMKAVPAQ